MSSETDGLLREKKLLEIGILTEFWSSLLEGMIASNHLLQLHVYFNNISYHSLTHSLIFLSFNRFSEFGDFGQQKLLSSDTVGRKRETCTRLIELEGRDESRALPPLDMVRIFALISNNW